MSQPGVSLNFRKVSALRLQMPFAKSCDIIENLNYIQAESVPQRMQGLPQLKLSRL